MANWCWFACLIYEVQYTDAFLFSPHGFLLVGFLFSSPPSLLVLGLVGYLVLIFLFCFGRSNPQMQFMYLFSLLMGFFILLGVLCSVPPPHHSQSLYHSGAEEGHESISRNCWSDQLDSPWILQLQFHHSPRLQKHLTYKAFMCISGGGERPWWSWQQLYKPTSTMLSRTDILLSLQTQDRSPCSSNI